MNFYDKIDELIRSFKATPEYKEFINLKNILKEDKEKYESLKEFKQKQTQLQIEMMNKGEVSKEKQDEMENLYSILIRDENIVNLFRNEMQLNVMLADMQKALGENLKEIIEF